MPAAQDLGLSTPARAPGSGAAQPPPATRAFPSAPRPGRGHPGRYVPLAVGCFALLLAALLPGYVYPRLAVLPQDPRLAQVQEGRDGTVMVVDTTSPAGAREVRGVDVRVVTYVSAATPDPPAGTVVWRLATTTTARGHGL